jgi:hypothetical protein
MKNMLKTAHKSLHKSVEKIINKGSNCSREGKKYELEIYNILKKCTYNNISFNTQLPNQLGGCSAENDLVCNYYNKENDKNYKIGIEVKKLNAPDWMQCSLIYDNILNKWTTNLKNKIPVNAKKIFEELLQKIQTKSDINNDTNIDSKTETNLVPKIDNYQLFNNKIPPFLTQNLTHDEWLKIKSETTDFNDIYINIDNNIIKNLYKEKDCHYIQISKKGLYHLGEDICSFNVPEFDCKQELRIRIKIHARKNFKGICKLSVMMSCKPKNINSLKASNFSLDNISKLPVNLIHHKSGACA